MLEEYAKFFYKGAFLIPYFVGCLFFLFAGVFCCCNNTVVGDSEQVTLNNEVESESVVYDNWKVSENEHTENESKSEKKLEFLKTFLSFIGISNTIFGTLIVSNEKYKYGYLLNSILQEVFCFHWIYIGVYAVLWLIAMYHVYMKNLHLSIMLTIGLVFIFIAFAFLFYCICLSKKRTDSIILAAIKNKLEKTDNYNEKYKILLDSGIKIMRYISEKTKSGQIDSKKMLFRFIKLVQDNVKKNDVTMKKEYTRQNGSQKDIVFLLQEVLTIYLKDVVASEKKDSKHLIINSIDEILEKNCFDELYMAIALWLYFNVDSSTSTIIINSFLIYGEYDENVIKRIEIVFYYIYSQIISKNLKSELSKENDFEQFKEWSNRNNAILKKYFNLYDNNPKKLADLNENLLYFKMRMIKRLFVEKFEVYSSSFLILERRILATKLLKMKNNEKYFLTSVEELKVFLHIKK